MIEPSTSSAPVNVSVIIAHRSTTICFRPSQAADQSPVITAMIVDKMVLTTVIAFVMKSTTKVKTVSMIGISIWMVGTTPLMMKSARNWKANTSTVPMICASVPITGNAPWMIVMTPWKALTRIGSTAEPRFMIAGIIASMTIRTPARSGCTIPSACPSTGPIICANCSTYGRMNRIA